ncbi:hypothetical protein TNCV_2114171 [Trichonephila clavipes]|nr:hypothetical protein TNCV_2114171 [Trichonephila clavipes]
MAAATLDVASTNRNVFNDVIKDEHGRQNGETFFSDESWFCSQHQDGRTLIWCHPDEPTLATCIRHCHTGP